MEQAKGVVQRELDRPSQLLGYQAMQKKVRQEHNLNIQTDLVHAVMFELHPEGLEQGRVVGLEQCRRDKLYHKTSKLGLFLRHP